MNNVLKGCAIAALSALAACAENPTPPPPPPPDTGPAHEETVRELMEVMHSHQLIDGMASQLDAMTQSSLKQALGDQIQTLTPEQQAIIDDMRSRMVALFKDELKWENFEPQIVASYEKTFTQQEVEGMLTFYKSPAGQAVVAKMPLVLQNSMQIVQTHMAAVMPKIKQIEQDSIARLKALKPSHPSSGAATQSS